jgi:phage gp46-like protein
MDLKLAVIPSAPGLPPTFDFQVVNGDLALDDGLETSLIISLFTDRRAGDDDVLPDPMDSNRRGWWGDSYAPIQGDLMGSRLWLRARERDEKQTFLRMKLDLEEATEWYVADGISSKVECDASRLRPDVVQYSAVIHRNAQAPRQFQFLDFWGSP